MEFCILMLLYYLSQKPDFAESVKPLMCKLKDSEHMLSFLNDLSSFTQTLRHCSCSGGEKPSSPPPPPKDGREKEDGNKNADKKTPQSPTAGIADEFIEQILESYLQKNR